MWQELKSALPIQSKNRYKINFFISVEGANIMQSKPKLIELLCSDPVKRFLKEHEGQSGAELALRYSGKVPFELGPVLTQLDIRKKGQLKLPEHLHSGALFTARAYEQCSSEQTAKYKASRIRGGILLNLCGGIGVDDWAFASVFDRVLSLEPDKDIHDLALYNLNRLGIGNVERINLSAEEFLQADTRKFDVIYADPDRRSEGKRLVGMKELQPDLPAMWEQVRQRSDRQLLKLSPLYPLEILENELPGLERIMAVSVNHELKEILAFYGTTQPSQVLREAVMLTDKGSLNFEGLPAGHGGFSRVRKEDSWFMECDASLSKTGLSLNLAAETGWQALVPNGVYQSGDHLPDSVFGRVFRIVEALPYSARKFRAYLQSKGIDKAHFNTRYFRSTAAELKRFHRLKDGGEDYFFFYENGKGKAEVIHGMKLS